MQTLPCVPVGLALSVVEGVGLEVTPEPWVGVGVLVGVVPGGGVGVTVGVYCGGGVYPLLVKLFEYWLEVVPPL